MNSRRGVRAARGAALAAGIMAFASFVLASVENLFLFHPARKLASDPSVLGLDYEDVLIDSSDGVQLHGWYLPAAGSPTILYLHGNGGNIADRIDKAACLVHQGYPVLMVDYRGYGGSSGSPSEEGVYRDAVAMYQWLRREHGLEPGEIVVWGMSLGGAVAVELASRVEVGALIAESTFTDTREVASIVYPWLPRLFLRQRFDSRSKVGRLTIPKLFIHGGQDEVVPLAMGQSLYEAAAPPKSFYLVPGAKHANAYAVGGMDYLDRIAKFLGSSR